AFEWEASHGQLLSKNTLTQNVTDSKRALAFPHERLHQEGKSSTP
ncbi:MAG: hypothetical protein RLZZ74_3195, partial [Cyanobacteriota bacterium]